MKKSKKLDPDLEPALELLREERSLKPSRNVVIPHPIDSVDEKRLRQLVKKRRMVIPGGYDQSDEALAVKKRLATLKKIWRLEGGEDCW